MTKDPTQFRRADAGWDLQPNKPSVVYAVASGQVYKANNDDCGFGDFYLYVHLDTPVRVGGNTYTDIYYGHVHYGDGTNGTSSVLGTHIDAGKPIAYTYADPLSGSCHPAWPAPWLEIGFGTSVPVGHFDGTNPTVAGLDMEQYLNGTRNNY